MAGCPVPRSNTTSAAPPVRLSVIVNALAAPVSLPVSTSWKFAPFWTTDAVASMPVVLLIASASPCSVTSPVIVTVVPPITSVPPEATMVVSLSACVLVVPVTCARASSLMKIS